MKIDFDDDHIDRSHPVHIRVGRKGKAVVIHLVDVIPPIGMDVDTARVFVVALIQSIQAIDAESGDVPVSGFGRTKKTRQSPPPSI